MSKDNLFLGMARGSVGDVVFSRFGGQQVARARNRAPKNPRSWLQLAQRSVMKTVMQSYSAFQAITNHSFQGYSEGTACQSHYVKLNVEQLRNLIASYIEENKPETVEELNMLFNFAQKSTTVPLLNTYIISEGSIPQMPSVWAAAQTPSASSEAVLLLDSNNSDGTGVHLSIDSTYQDVCDVLGLQQGDQLTLFGVAINPSATIGDSDAGKILSTGYARIILSPSDGDMTKAFFSQTSTSDNKLITGINDESPDNEGTANLSWGCGGYLKAPGAVLTSMSGMNDGAIAMGAGCWIASRYNNGVWQRSTQSLVVRKGEVSGTAGVAGSPMLIWSLADAIKSYMDDTSSTLYLNGAQANESL